MAEAAGGPREHPPEPYGDTVSRAHLAQVRAEVGDATLRRYARIYVELLPGRLDRMETAIAESDAAEATRVMFDLRVSSEMLGTRRLSALVSALEEALARGLPATAEQLARVRTEAELVAAVIRAAMTDGSLRPAEE